MATDLITRNEAAAMLGLAKGTIRNTKWRKLIPATYLSGHACPGHHTVMFRRADVLAILEERMR